MRSGTTFRDLRDYIGFLDEHGELKRFRGADWKYEIGGLTELVVREQSEPQTVLFDDVEGYESGYRVLTNIANTPFQWTAARGYEPTRDLETAITTHMEYLAEDHEVKPPVTVQDGPVTDTVLRGGDVDVTRFPVPYWRQKDGGRYVGTACAVVTDDASTGDVNAGTYRAQVHGPDSVTLHISPGKDGRRNLNSYLERGEPCPVLLSAGQPVDIFLAAAARVPANMNEFEYAGTLRGEAIEVVEGDVTGLPMPKNAEIVLEGHVYPDAEPVAEGPFGEWTGYYAGGAHLEEEHVVKPVTVERIYHRPDPILTGSVPLRPPAKIRTQIRTAATLWDELETAGMPGVTAVNSLSFGPSWFDVIAIEQSYAGHSVQLGHHAATGPAAGYHGRFTVVVDDDIDVYDEDAVLWAICSRCDPETDIHVISGTWSSPLDPTIHPQRKREGDFTNSRAVVDATRPYHWRDEFPEVNDMSADLRAELLEKWGDEIHRSDPSGE